MFLRGSYLAALALAWPTSGPPLAAQVVRLPAVVPDEQPDAARLVSHPDSSAELLQEPGQTGPPPQLDLPSDARPGVFQKLIFTGTWLGPGGRDELGISGLELSTVLALPLPSRRAPLIVTPGFAVRYLDGPESRDLPGRVYDAFTQFRWMSRVGPRLGVDLAVTPGIYSDFEQGTDDGLRVPGHGVAMWTFNPRLKLVLGASYLDREDIDVLPIGGLIWSPHGDLNCELIFPRPRIARRVYLPGVYAQAVQHWVYLAAKLGGGAWAIRRAGGGNDVFNYRDYRIFLGAERKAIGQLEGRLEVGYVFGRKIQYRSPTPDLEPAGTVMLRAGLIY